MTLEQTTKYFSVSRARPGPMRKSHHPGLSFAGSCPAWNPAAWALPDNAWSTRMALLFSLFSFPYVS